LGLLWGGTSSPALTFKSETGRRLGSVAQNVIWEDMELILNSKLLGGGHDHVCFHDFGA